MSRIIESKWMGYGVGKRYIETAGRSTETKPTEDVVTGSLFFEVDTGKMYIYDEVSGTWNQIGG